VSPVRLAPLDPQARQVLRELRVSRDRLVRSRAEMRRAASRSGEATFRAPRQARPSCSLAIRSGSSSVRPRRSITSSAGPLLLPDVPAPPRTRRRIQGTCVSTSHMLGTEHRRASSTRPVVAGRRVGGGSTLQSIPLRLAPSTLEVRGPSHRLPDQALWRPPAPSVKQQARSNRSRCGRRGLGPASPSRWGGPFLFCPVDGAPDGTHAHAKVPTDPVVAPPFETQPSSLLMVEPTAGQTACRVLYRLRTDAEPLGNLRARPARLVKAAGFLMTETTWAAHASEPTLRMSSNSFSGEVALRTSPPTSRLVTANVAVRARAAIDGPGFPAELVDRPKRFDRHPVTQPVRG
jgi:hypothetical protein